tara:strand:- start:10 stop:459 length:450 start_codon:yes stop_codon:yes gene_type:complete
MEKNRVKEASIQKYFNALVDLKNVLSYTNRISLNHFCEKNQLSKNLPRVLQKGGIIKCIVKGKYSQWEWTTIEPNKHMAVKSIQMLGILNPPRSTPQKTTAIIDGRKLNGGSRVGAGRKLKQEDVLQQVIKKTIDVRVFWGLFTFTINI